MDALPFLSEAKTKPGPLYVVYGDEPFLKRQVIRTLRDRALGEEADDQAISVYPGDKTTFAEVFDDLDTLPFFHPRRFVIVDNADKFVTEYRTELETRLAHLPASGLLILDVKSWTSTTRLAKLVGNTAAINCKSPGELAGWCSAWCLSQYQKQLAGDAARLLVELGNFDMGVLDQELLKLSIAVGARSRIEFADVDQLVGNNRTQDIWRIFDLIAAGDSKKALAILDGLFDQGEEPFRMLGAMAYQLRRCAQAARIAAQGTSVGAAIAQAGLNRPREAETLMRHLGRPRLNQLYDGLLQMNMDLRGDSPLPPRTLFERFLLKLAKKNEAVR